MKSPPVVSKSWKSSAAAAATSSPSADANPVVAKVALSLDPLLSSDGPSALQESFQWKQRRSINLTMEPHSENFGEYGKLCRERTNKAMIKTRQILVCFTWGTMHVIGNDYGENMRPLPGMVGLVPSGSKDKKKVIPTKGSETKRTRRDRRELENIIFKLFERQPNWALKQLVKETDQPEQFLKEILNDLCLYNKRGPNQGTHELKPEYKKSNEEMDTNT